MLKGKGFHKFVISILIFSLIISASVFADSKMSSDDILDFEWDNPPEILTDEQVNELKSIGDGENSFDFETENPNSRINSSGGFSFNIGTGVTSDKFTLAKKYTSTNIRVNSQLVGAGGSNRTEFGITLYSKKQNSLVWKSEGFKKYKVCTVQSNLWSGLPLNATYYMHIRTPKVASSGKTVKGTGTISNFGSVK